METHLSISIIQTAEGTDVSCGCGWVEHLEPGWAGVTQSQKRMRLQASDINYARNRWYWHSCTGRVLAEVST